MLLVKAQTLSGKIGRFPNRTFALYAVYAYSLIFLDSIKTNEKGEFYYPLALTLKKKYPPGVIPSKYITFRLQLNWNQFADIIGHNHYSQTNTINISRKEIKEAAG